MKFTIKYFLFFFLILFTLNTYAQKEGNIWYFGNNAGIDFNSGTPIALTDGQMNTMEGCASICDSLGNLLFYTDGLTVWDRTHNIMPNGIGLMGHNSSTQSAIIVKKPKSKNIYYIFTIDAEAGINGLRYSELDMNLNGGGGDITSNKNILIITPTCEKVTVVKHRNNSDFWIITRLFNSNAFNCYLLTKDGLNVIPIINITNLYLGNNGTNAIGYLKASHNGKKIVSANTYLKNFELFDFNNSTGILSNAMTFSLNNDNPYGVEFSPDNNLLYISSQGKIKLNQYNLLSGNQQDIENSKKIIYETNTSLICGALQLGPDGKIYYSIATTFANKIYSLGVISNPNNQGLICNYTYPCFLTADRDVYLGLPNFYNSIFTKQEFSYDKACLGSNTEFFMPDVEYDNVLWDFGDGGSSSEPNPTHLYGGIGTYNVKLNITLGGITETFSQDIEISELPVIDIGDDATICQGDNFVLDASYPFASYLWQDNSQNATFNVTQSGLHSVTVTDNSGCSGSASVNITVLPAPGLDASICNGDNIQINATGVGNIVWGSDAGLSNYNIFNPIASPSISTLYSATVTDGNGCSNSDDILITVNNIPNINAGNDENICYGTNVQLNATGVGGFVWTPSDGLNDAFIANPIASPLINTSYTVEVTDDNNCRNSDIVNVQVTTVPNIEVGDDITICDGDSVQLNAITSGLTIRWRPSLNLSDSTIINPWAKPNDTVQYKVFSYNNNCFNFESLTINVKPLPYDVIINDTTVCNDETVLLNAKNNGSSFLWSTGETTQTIEAKEGTYSLTITNDCGSYTTTTNVSTKFCNINIPNIITPNGDGVNDFFFIGGITPQTWNLEVFNRWGNMVFKSNAYNNDFNGKDLTDGVYFYILSSPDGDVFTGNVSVIGTR